MKDKFICEYARNGMCTEKLIRSNGYSYCNHFKEHAFIKYNCDDLKCLIFNKPMKCVSVNLLPEELFKI